MNFADGRNYDEIRVTKYTVDVNENGDSEQDCKDERSGHMKNITKRRKQMAVIQI